MNEGYKMTELGEIPQEWDIVKFGTVVNNLDSKRVPLKSEDRSNVQGFYPYYGAQGIIDFIDKYIFDGKYLLVAEDGENVKSRKYDIAFIADGKFWLNNHAHILQSNHRSNIYFLKNLLNFISIKEFITGQAQPKLNKSALESIKISLPPIEEQQKIAEILTTIDEKIEVLETQITQTQELKKGLMQQLLTKGIGHTKFKDSLLGEIPESWEVGTIEDFCSVDNNLRKPINSETRKSIEGDYPYYGPTGIVDYINEYSVEGEYTLLGEDGDHFLKYDTWSMTNLVRGKFNVNNHAHLIRGIGNCKTGWIHCFFQHRNIISHLTRQGAGRYKLTKASLLNLPMLLPSPLEQDKITSILKTIDNKSQVLREKKDNYTEFKKGLMQQLLTGKLRVKTTVMCYVKDGFKLCTCNTIEATNAQWVLERYNATLPDMIVIGSYLPYDFDAADATVIEMILASLNQQHCFDFDYQPKTKDSLAIALDAAKTKWIYLVYKNKKWITDDTSPLENWKQKLEALNHGIVNIE